MAIEKTDLLNRATSGVLGNAGDVDNAETGAVVSLVGETVDDVLVVVDGAGRALEVAGVDGLLEVGDVEDVGGGVAVGGGADGVNLIEFVVEEEIAHGRVDDPALVAVGVADVGGAGDNGGVLLVGHVHDGEGVLVEGEADLAARVLLAWALVDDALGIVDVAVLANAAGGDGVLGVGDIDHEESTGAGGVAGVGSGAAADAVDHVDLLVGDEVVGSADAGEESDVLLLAEGLGLEPRVPPVLHVQELVEVEDLDTVATGLGANVGIVANDLDVAPAGHLGLGIEAAEICDAASETVDLDESDTVSLANNTELAAGLGGPSPDVVASQALGTQILVAQETVHVDVVALVLP